jgi:poly-beta-1,6-N-acetyl-D-glucosamine synthase
MLFFLFFWISLFVIGYTYIGYGVVLWCILKIKKKNQSPTLQADRELPAITHIVAAYNEEAYIEAKIKNSLALDYPADKVTLLVVTDGSTDRTQEIVQRYPSVKNFHEAKRMGKIHAVNRVMKLVQTPLVIFSDANTTLNHEVYKKIVRHYQHEDVGGVAGEKRIATQSSDNASGSGEGLYWRYESLLKKMDSEVYSIVGAAGELFSIRTNLFEEPPADTLIEDFYLSLKIAAKGFRFAYEPEAYATETASVNVKEEWKRKVRITAGGFQAMARLLDILNPFRYGLLSFQYFSHRVLRWTLAPLALLLLLVSNILLSINYPIPYLIFLALQILFYFIALLGYFLKDKKIKVKGFFVPYYFLVMNLAVYAGLVKYLRGKQSVVWEKAERAVHPS